jgi:HEAT repeat protein
LGEIKDSRAQAGLEHSLMDMDSSVRRAAAQALGKLADASVVESLRKLSIDADRYVREAAADAILRIQERHGKAAPVEPGRNMAGKALVS